MLQTLSQFVDISDPNIQQAIKELKILELEIPQEEMIQLIKETFSSQQDEIRNQTFHVQVGQQCEINLIENHYNKPLLCEYLDGQFEGLVEVANEITVILQEILQTLDQKSLVENKSQLYKFQEEAQKQIILLNQPLQEQKVENSEEINKNEFIQFVKDQKNLLAYKNQVQQIEKKTNELRRIIFDKIEEQNNLSEAVAKKMEMNIDNELKLLEKTTELKLIAKIENDLLQEVLKMEKSNANSLFSNPGLPNESAEQLEKQIAKTFNLICNLFQEMKEQKIKNNDLIYDQILNNVVQQEKTLIKIQQMQESNVHQFIDYINNFPEFQQYCRDDIIHKVKEQKDDFQFCQQWKLRSYQEQNCKELDEFLKLQQDYQDIKENTDQLTEKFNSEWLKQQKQLESIKQFLINLQQLI